MRMVFMLFQGKPKTTEKSTARASISETISPCTGKFGTGGAVEQFKGGLALEICFPVLSHGFRENMSMKINNQ